MPDTTDVERTADGHHVVIGGRRWQASDPGIPEALRQELVDELMAARRAVRAREPRGRARVQDAKVALGERGRPWWEEPDEEALAGRIRATTRALLRKRDGGSICPSDVARVVGGEQWRDRLGAVRTCAAGMAADGFLLLTQRGVQVGVDARGPIRLTRGPRFGEDGST